MCRLRCDQCQPYKYGFSSDGCKDCECDNIGSKSLQCDTYGQCPCLDNVEGRKCDRCKENKYDRQRGCVDCPHCYNLVQKSARDHVNKLEELRNILDEIERNPTVIDDDKFEEQLRGIESEVEDLTKRAKTGLGVNETSLADTLEDMKVRQEVISKSLTEIDKNIINARENGISSKHNILYSKTALKDDEEALNDVFELLYTDGKIALEKAIQKAEEYGQQSEKMTKIAQEARELADDLNEQVDGILKVAYDGKNKSIEAYELAKNATDHQKNISEEIRVLRNEVGITEDKLERVKNLTEEAYNRATETKNRAIDLLNQAKNLIIPDVNIGQLKEQTEASKAEAKRLINKTNELLAENGYILNEIKEQILLANDLLDVGLEQNDKANGFLNNIKLYKVGAEKAVNLSDTTLKDARVRYDTLSRKLFIPFSTSF